jgi:hypothetical protein
MLGSVLLLAGWPVRAQLELVADPAQTHLALANSTQRIRCDKTEGGGYRLATDIRHGTTWEPLFDGQLPLLQGSRFNLEPTACEVRENSATRKTLLLKGIHRAPDYPWEARIELQADSPLIKFVITCQLPADLKLDTPQPTIALWMNQSTATLALDQGPVSQTGEAYEVPFNFGFPAAYLWDRGREAVVFFNMTPMTWFSPDGLLRFKDVQIKTQVKDGRIGLGMHPRKRTGDTIHAGEMVSEFYLYGGRRESKPTKFEALDKMMQVCAPLHPADSEYPRNTLTGGEVSWEDFAGRTIHDLMIEGVACSVVKKPWSDEPLKLVTFRDKMIGHPDWLKKDPKDLPTAWNFPTVNHHLAPWMLYARLHATSDSLEFARIKKDAVPRFYDPATKMIRSFPPPLPADKAMELSWQSYVFYQEMLQLEETLAAEDFNPAIIGRMLMGLEGMLRYAHNVNYVFSTYFNPIAGQPLTFYENNGLGTVREPWTVGSHAYVMTRAYELTGDVKYQAEAARSLNALLHTMHYTESNKYYTRTYTEAMDMPPSDLTGNAYGAVAAWKLYQQSGDPQWRRVSRDILNTLLRQTFWHEDRTDVVNRELRHAGLFYAFVGASCATPWETSEAHQCIAWLLGQDIDNPLVPLLLKLSNLNRINSFYFYPAVYGPATRALNPKQRRDVGQYFPVEPLYQLECMAGSIGNEGTAPYMASNSIWNWWLYEALGVASNRAVLVLNTASLTGCEEALEGADRELIAFNPTAAKLAFALRLKNLPAGEYAVTRADAAGRADAATTRTAAQLMAGIPLTLESLGYARIAVRRADGGVALKQIEINRTARRGLAHVYQLLQERARDNGVKDALVGKLEGDFHTAMRTYGQRNDAAAAREAEAMLRQLGFKAQPAPGPATATENAKQAQP